MASPVPDELTPSRVSVWDAHELDKGIYDVMKAQFQTIISYLPSRLTTRFEPEIDAIIKSALWLLSVEKTFATFGQRLLHLKYEKATPVYKLRILGLLKIGASYFKGRLVSILNQLNRSELSEKAIVLVQRLETAVNILNVISFVMFLRKGGASTFLERFLRLNPVTTMKPSDRSIGYTFMTRELLWHGLIELLVLVIPLLNYHSMKRMIRKLIGSNRKGVVDRNYVLDKDTRCPVCQMFPILARNMGCSHIFCHYCLAANRLADPNFECPACGFSDPSPSAMVEIDAKVLLGFLVVVIF